MVWRTTKAKNNDTKMKNRPEKSLAGEDALGTLTSSADSQVEDDGNDDTSLSADDGGPPPIIRDETEARGSLNATYGNRVGFLQSLSLLLNACLMIYAHVGVSGAFLSNQKPIDEPSSNGYKSNNTNITNNSAMGNSTEFTGLCTPDDFEIWKNGGSLRLSDNSNFCATKYYGSSGCIFDETCTISCYIETFGYTEECASCFAPIPFCSFEASCATPCSEDPNGLECEECSIDCFQASYSCAGFPEIEDTRAPTVSPTVDLNSLTFLPPERKQDTCERQQAEADYESVQTFYVVYEIKFFEAIKTAWTSDARLLAVIVVVFSGIWPYTKNILLMVAWYLPMTEKRRSSMLLWLRRLGKYTLVDVYVVIALIVGVLLEITVANGVTVIIKGEPRLALVAFLFATLWEFVHIEWMTSCHHKTLSHVKWNAHTVEPDGHILDSLRFRSSCRSEHNALACKSPACLQATMWLLLCLSIGLFLGGSIVESISFTSVLAGETVGCVKSYNIYSLGMALISPFSLYLSTAIVETWILFIAYILLVIVAPLFVHLIQGIVCVFNVKIKSLCRTADICWTFASVDVLLLALFMVQYKFKELIATLAGNEGSQFFGMTSDLGPGFFILVAYSVFAGYFQYLFNCAVSEFYQIDVHDKVNYAWTNIFACFLTNVDDNRKATYGSRRPLDREGTESTMQEI